MSSIAIHPDGLILAVGLRSGQVQILDIRDMKVAHSLEAPSQTAVRQLDFSNKGIFLAVIWE